MYSLAFFVLLACSANAWPEVYDEEWTTFTLPNINSEQVLTEASALKTVLDGIEDFWTAAETKRGFPGKMQPPKVNVSFDMDLYPSTAVGLYYSSSIHRFFPLGVPAKVVLDPANQRSAFNLTLGIQIMYVNESFLYLPTRNMCVRSNGSHITERNFFGVTKQVGSIGNNEKTKFFGTFANDVFTCNRPSALSVTVHRIGGLANGFSAPIIWEFGDELGITAMRTAVVDVRDISDEIDVSIFNKPAVCNTPITLEEFCAPVFATNRCTPGSCVPFPTVA